MKRKKPTRQDYEKTLEEIRQGTRSLPPDEVTGVIELARQELDRACKHSSAVLDAARHTQSEAAKVSSSRPPPGSGDDLKPEDES